MKLALSSLASTTRPFPEFIAIAKEMGFEWVELVLEGSHLHEDFDCIAELLESYSMQASVHSPFSDLNIASFSEKIGQESLRQVRYSMEKALQLEARMVIFHSGRVSPYGMWYRHKAWDLNVGSIRQLFAMAEELGVEASVENMPEGLDTMLSSPREVEELGEEVAGAKFTFDIGHASTWGRPEELAGTMGERIANVHIHDNLGNDEHLAVGDGGIDFKRVISELEGYNGAVVVELHRERDVPKSRERLLRMLP